MHGNTYRRGPRWPFFLGLLFFITFATVSGLQVRWAVKHDDTTLLVLSVIFGSIAVVGIPGAIAVILHPFYLPPREETV